MALNFLKVERDKDGQIVPRKGKTPTLGMEVEVKPITYGEALSYDSFGKGLKDWSNKDKAKLLTNSLVSCEGEEAGEFTEEDIKDYEAYALSDLIEAVAIFSALHRLYEEEVEGNEQGPPGEGEAGGSSPQ